MRDTMAEKTLARQGYHLVGSGAVKPCLWLNRSLRGGDQCYKHHFYGIASHRCVQMTPHTGVQSPLPALLEADR
ncbi:hypothetical protein [Methanothrix sp.]|uniref:hypothetical protein n=1 Tax=Methanothrix sp. TaxID=90426 RepID=UPI0025E9F4C1|nr:hypothetical protein [Methanothrix sp.]